MKLSNFSLDRRIGDSFSNYIFYASVDVTTGILFWKKTERKEICRKYGDTWFFVDTGKYTPEFQAEELARTWTAQTGQMT